MWYGRTVKAARELLSIGSNIASNKANKKILDRFVEVTRTLLSAERVFILELDHQSKELLVTHSNIESAIGLKIPADSGVEGISYF